MRIQFSSISYINLILYHIAIVPLFYYLPFLSKPYGILLLILGYLYIVKNQNRNEEALLVAAYVIGNEVFLKMINGNILYEIGKYSVIFYLFLGMYYKGFSRSAIVYWIFLLLLIPGIIYATYNLNFDTDIRKTIAFNISGPICLGFSAIYCYRRNVTFEQLNKIVLCIGMPVVSIVTNMVIIAPNIKKYAIGTASNPHTSGNWASNQVSTAVGLGLFCIFVRILLHSKDKLLLVVNIFLAVGVSYRGMATFSRGGMFTSFFMIITFTAMIFLISNSRIKFNMLRYSVVATVIISATWIYTSEQTNGMINKRYANQDPSGREEKSKFTGRENLFEEELDLFLKNPFFGVGVAKSKELRLEETGIDAAVHSELSRMLSEHGAFGFFGLVILFLTPLILYLDNTKHIFLIPFFIFWILTINHSAMRLAAPAFVYALTLLKVNFNEKPTLPG